ncbi:hypothetical protein P7C71_g1370, partial [Lecanoromycetidae sp. Uapishka_2]
MDGEEDDDMYEHDENLVPTGNNGNVQSPIKKEGEDEEEGEEVEEDESDSDIDIITERKGDQKAESIADEAIADFPEDDKPWRRPGTDMTDYFNYGFDEFTWASYCLKQQTLRKEVTDSKKQMEEMQSFLSMPGGMPPMPGMPGPPGGAQPGIPPTGGPADIPPEMQQMMSQMVAQGMDPSQMDPSTFFQMMQGGQGGAGDPQTFTQQGYGSSQQQMGYSFG